MPHPAFGFECPDEAVEVSGQRQRPHRAGTLHRPRPGDQHLEVVEAAEQFLRARQGGDASLDDPAGGRRQQLQRITELLRGDSYFVKPVRQVQAAGTFDRPSETLGARRGMSLGGGEVR